MLPNLPLISQMKLRERLHLSSFHFPERSEEGGYIFVQSPVLKLLLGSPLSQLV